MATKRHVQEEGLQFPGKTYVEAVLEPAYNHAKQELLLPMIAVHKAHLIMLLEQRLLSQKDALNIAKALLSIDLEQLRLGNYNGQFEDLFFEVEHKLLKLSDDSSNNLHLARSRNDIGIAIYRITLRQKLLRTLSSALELNASLLTFAKKHIDTIFIAHTHTQQAQPTTIAHYIAAVSDSLARDVRRLQAAYANCNLSSLGAAALTTSGFDINRERVAELLAFDGLIENSYDAVSGADYVAEIVASIQLAAINLGRFVQELLLWCTQEFAVAKVASPYVQISSIMPQKRNPVSIEHIRSLLSSIAGTSQTVLTMIHNTPFGDIVDTEDDMQPYAWKGLDTLEVVYRLLSKVIDSLEINKDVLHRRAAASFATVTELADTLVREEGIPFRNAHKIVSILVSQAVEQSKGISDLSLQSLNEIAIHTIGAPLKLSREKLKLTLDPKHFVNIRKLRGGPSPSEITRALEDQQHRLHSLEQWLSERETYLATALAQLDAILSNWQYK
ncbi:argininosuccinate lyase [Fontibacillus panacisegetis]|uniref:Argininosuccinate lyase n=1 Tax=Fontibacillus panacisegetis TaxID=670482 RepID=A0A1G7QGH8_9BACL|nr:argininosuccinate lyase [Fontibacillus panacisegetis]SDF97059.1 argininosuccinate lyase [Fontibacillus panacisegetis]